MISLWPRGSSVRNPVGARDFCVFQSLLGPTHSPIQWLPEIFLQGVKQLGPEFDYSTPPSAEVKNEWSCMSNPALRLRRVDRDKIP